MAHPGVRPSALTRALAAGVAGLLSLTTVAAQQSAPALALGRLKLGNDRFVRNASQPVPLGAPAREAVAKVHAPFAMVLSCADARVPPEYIFNAALGDLFVVRAAAQTPDKSILATLEHGVQRLHVSLLVVMGHESCDLVQNALESTDEPSPNLQYLAKAIRTGTDRTAADRRDLRTAILTNVEQVINDTMAGSQVLRNAAEQGILQIVGAYYELSSGRVVFSEPVTLATATSQK